MMGFPIMGFVTLVRQRENHKAPRPTGFRAFERFELTQWGLRYQ
jgi:hypothetical protein